MEPHVSGDVCPDNVGLLCCVGSGSDVAIEGDLKAMIYNPVASNHSKMADFQTFEVDTKLAPINVGP
jgi:hypothetical protein